MTTMKCEFPQLPALVVGRLHHARSTPVEHSFAMPHYQWLVDVDDLPDFGRMLRPVTTIASSDHLSGGASGGGIRGDLGQFLAEHDVTIEADDRVVMLAHARIAGHVFDPLTVYWCIKENGQLRALVFEVHNTYGQRHAYLVKPDAAGRARVPKEFFVSPFNDVSGWYDVRMITRADRVTVVIELSDEHGVSFSASVTGRPQPANRRSVLQVALRHAFMTQRVSLMIRAHGIRLWLAGLKIYRRPDARPRRRPVTAGALGARLRRSWLGRQTAQRVVGLVATRVPVDLRLPGGRTVDRRRSASDHQGAGRPAIEIVRPERLYERLAIDPKQAIGEAYVAGDWRAAPGTDLAEALTPFAQRMSDCLPAWLMRLRRVVDRPLPAEQENSKSGSRRNIEAHYDLSNQLFAGFLDSTMSYSSALFERAQPLAEQSLEMAQLRKIDAALDAAGVGAGTRLLEIGCGWGSLAIRAAQRGAQVKTTTLSREQADWTRRRVIEESLEDRIEVVELDYREIEGRFDALISIEMIEAVGEQYWPEYFAAIDRLLVPGGEAVIQSILMDHDRLMTTRNSYGWIQKHIFPGGLIPSEQAIREVATTQTQLNAGRALHFGPDYAETLRRWRQRFAGNWQQLSELGFDEEFRRKWEFYLAYCQAGFAAGYLDVAQIRLFKGADQGAGGRAAGRSLEHAA